MIDYDLKKIKALFFDVDGVLSTSTVSVDEHGIPLRSVNIKDGYAIQLAVRLGLNVAIITGGNSVAIVNRYKSLGVNEIYTSANVKKDVYTKLLSKFNLQTCEVLYMGDDIPDYEVMSFCGLPCCPKDAAIEIQQISKYISPFTGGNGCVRDVIEQVLRGKGLWKLDKMAFGW